MRRSPVIAALLLPLVGACRDPRPDAGGATAASPAASGSAAGSAALGGAPRGSAEYADAQLPVSADYEARAEQAITSDNYLRELDRIEAAMRDGGTDADAGPATQPHEPRRPARR